MLRLAVALIATSLTVLSPSEGAPPVPSRQVASGHGQGLAPDMSAGAVSLLDASRGRSRLARELLGRSVEGRPIEVVRVRGEGTRALVVGCIHGNECAGMAVTRLLLDGSPPVALDLWVLPNLNPDGLAHGTRGNARGVDLNRDFDGFSQRETRIARDLIRRIRPDVTIWFHQPQALVRAWGRSRTMARRYARLAGEPYRSLEWPHGAATRWQNGLGQIAFVVELPRGPLSRARAIRHARTILELEN